MVISILLTCTRLATLCRPPMLLKEGHAGAVVLSVVLTTKDMQLITRGSDLVGLCHVRTNFVSLTIL